MEWKEVRLGDVADVQTGPFGSQLHKDNYVNKGTPIVTVEHLGNKWFTSQNLPMVSDEDKLRLAKYCSQEGDVIFSRVGSVDRCSYVSKEYSGWLFSGRCLRVRPRSGINPEYLYYFLTNEGTKQYIRNIAVGATMPSINTKLLNEVPVKIPSLPDQCRIASILSSLDRKIELNNKINADLEEMAQAIFKNWFVDFEPFKDGKFVDSELGMIPEGWKVGTLGDFCKCLLGGTPSRSKEEYWNGDVNWINSSEINKFRILEASEKITELGLSKSATKLLPKKTTVLAITGATLGQVSLLEIDTCANQSVIGVLENAEVPYEYIYPFIKDRIEMLIQHQTGGAQQHINKDNVESLIFLLPAKNVLENYISLVGPMYKRIESQCFENLYLSTLRDTLLPRLMSGELEVPE